MTLWLAGLAIGALFGWFWGYAAGQRSVVITLPGSGGSVTRCESESEPGEV